MSVVEPSNLTPQAAESGSFWDRLKRFFSQLFGGGSTEQSEVPAAESVSDESTVATDTPAAEDADEYVVASCGYRIRVPKSTDFSQSVSEMLPTVRQGLALLPPLPGVAFELLKEIQSSKSTASSVANIASSDPSLAASLIRTVNGAAFGLSRKITSVNEAISYLGFGMVKAMVVRLRLEEVMGAKADPAASDTEDLWVHSMAVSYVAEKLARDVAGVDAGFVATLGLLHDIGKLAMISQLPKEAVLLSQQILANPGESPRALEARILGVDHAGLGANLALTWKLPADLIQAIRWHHRPANAFEPGDPPALRKAVHLLQIANQLTKFCYPCSDHMEIDQVCPEAFELLGFEPSLNKLLTAPVQAAITRAMSFAEANSRRSNSTPRRFMRLLSAEAATAALATAPAGEPRVAIDDAAFESLFSSDAKEHRYTADGASAAVSRGITHARFHSVTKPAAIQKCANAIKTCLEEMDVAPEARSAATMTIRALLPNAVELCGKDDAIEVALQLQGRRVAVAIRADSLATSRRLGRDVDGTTSQRLAEVDCAHVLNLGWFEQISITSDGKGLGFWMRG